MNLMIQTSSFHISIRHSGLKEKTLISKVTQAALGDGYAHFVLAVANTYRAGLSICREVLQIMIWEVPPADGLIL